LLKEFSQLILSDRFKATKVKAQGKTDLQEFIYLFILLRLGVTYIYIYIKKNIGDNYKTRQGHHNSKNQLLWAQLLWESLSLGRKTQFKIDTNPGLA